MSNITDGCSSADAAPPPPSNSPPVSSPKESLRQVRWEADRSKRCPRGRKTVIGNDFRVRRSKRMHDWKNSVPRHPHYQHQSLPHLSHALPTRREARSRWIPGGLWGWVLYVPVLMLRWILHPFNVMMHENKRRRREIEEDIQRHRHHCLHRGMHHQSSGSHKHTQRKHYYHAI